MKETNYEIIGIDSREIYKAFRAAWEETKRKSPVPSRESELLRKIVESDDNPFRIKYNCR